MTCLLLLTLAEACYGKPCLIVPSTTNILTLLNSNRQIDRVDHLMGDKCFSQLGFSLMFNCKSLTRTSKQRKRQTEHKIRLGVFASDDQTEMQ